MEDQPHRAVEQAELCLLKIVFPRFYGVHEECWKCAVSKRPYASTYPLSQLTKVGKNYYCSKHLPRCMRKRGVKSILNKNICQIGQRIHVVCYGPFRGLRGTVQIVDVNTISSFDSSYGFYLIDLEGGLTEEPVWFEFNEVEYVFP